MGHMGHEAPAAAALGLYKPRRPQGSPLFRLVSDHVQRLQTVYDERFAREPRHGDRPDSDASPHPRRLDGSADRAESALDRLACSVVAPRSEPRHTSTTPIEFPILPGISSGLGVIESQVLDLMNNRFPSHNIILLGFSQGACLSSEFVIRHPRRYGGLLVRSGGLIARRGGGRTVTD